VAGSVTCGYRPGGWIDDGSKTFNLCWRGDGSWRFSSAAIAVEVAVCFGIGRPAGGLCFVPPDRGVERALCGDWSGQVAEKAAAIRTGAPILHVAVNSILMLLHNFVPTVFPWADAWNRLMGRLIPAVPGEDAGASFRTRRRAISVGRNADRGDGGLGMG